MPDDDLIDTPNKMINIQAPVANPGTIISPLASIACFVSLTIPISVGLFSLGTKRLAEREEEDIRHGIYNLVRHQTSVKAVILQRYSKEFFALQSNLFRSRSF
jgi:hypothetical protein